ncbi:putative TOM core complex subunit Tom6 [Fonsecaea pedrosoi]|nr:putative TOM core complex subunit Tom6 [Fonsecaea pedrosoi]
MPPKRITVQPATRRSQPKGWFGQVYHTLTSEENSSVVISVAMFGAAVAFFNSEWSEMLLPGF